VAKALAYVAVVAVTLTLASTLVAIWWQLGPKGDLLALLQLLLSWKVIAGGLAVGGAVTFEREIKSLILPAATPPR
jgi:hypothetical protein